MALVLTLASLSAVDAAANSAGLTLVDDRGPHPSSVTMDGAVHSSRPTRCRGACSKALGRPDRHRTPTDVTLCTLGLGEVSSIYSLVTLEITAVA